MSAGYVVRGKHKGRAVWADADDENGYEPRRGGKPVSVDSADAACFAKLEIEAQDCTDVSIFRVHDDGREERLPSYEEALAMLGADPLAALEAAERRLLEAGGWTALGEMDRHGRDRWRSKDGLTECRQVALTIERRRLAAKGGA